MRGAPLIVLAAALGAAGCKKKPVEPPVLPPPPVESPLKIASLSPSAILPGQVTDVVLFGSAFSRDMKVRVGAMEATAVAYKNDNQVTATLPPLDPGTYDVVVDSPSIGNRDVLRGGLLVEARDLGSACQFVVLYFETDQSSLNVAAESTLRTLVDCYGQSTDPIRVEGHADERGTVDYNLALSYRRALAVQRFLVDLGIPKARLPVSSFGEERPAIRGGSEDVWAQNRRVELTLDIR